MVPIAIPTQPTANQWAIQTNRESISNIAPKECSSSKAAMVHEMGGSNLSPASNKTPDLILGQPCEGESKRGRGIDAPALSAGGVNFTAGDS